MWTHTFDNKLFSVKTGFGLNYQYSVLGYFEVIYTVPYNIYSTYYKSN